MRACSMIAWVLLVSVSAFSQGVCPEPTLPDSGRLCTTLLIKDGHWAVDPQNTTLRQGQLPSQITVIEVIGTLESALKITDFPYRLGLDPDAKALDEKEPAANRRALQSFSGSWRDYATAALDAGVDGDRLIEQVRASLELLKRTTPFTSGNDDLDAVFGGESGVAQLNVLAFTEKTPIRVAGAGMSTKRAESLRGYLKAQRGHLWNPTALADRVREYYSYLGLTPTVETDPNLRAIEIVEGTRVQQIDLPSVGDKEGEISTQERIKALYAVLDDRDFRLVLKNNIEGETISYSRDLQREPGTEPFFFPMRAQIQQLWLAQSNLALSDAPATSAALPPPWSLPQPYIGIRVLRPAPDAPESPAEAPASADENGLITAAATDAGATEDRGLAAEKKSKPARKKHNFIGGEVSYRPGQGLSVAGIYQLSKLNSRFFDSALGVRVEKKDENKVAPSVNYAADYILFEKIHRRLSLQLNGSSRTSNNRFMAGVKQDETRAGGMIRFELEPFRDRGGKLLRFHAEGNQSTVTRRIPELPEVKNRLTTIDAGALFMVEVWERLNPWRAVVSPVMRWGLARSGEAAFNKFSVAGDAHFRLWPGFEFDSSESFKTASLEAPVFELPSLGGAESVRGFQVDEAIGRLAWTAQNEFWMPVPFANRLKGQGEFFRKMVRLAVFGDVGNVRDAYPGSKQGTRVGAGTGLRVQFGPVVLKGDVAYGFGPRTLDDSRIKFYFTVKSNLPF